VFLGEGEGDMLEFFRERDDIVNIDFVRETGRGEEEGILEG
jgi:hypothetical protein